MNKFHGIMNKIRTFMSYLKKELNCNLELGDFESCDHFITKHKNFKIALLSNDFNESHSNLSICYKIYELLLRLKLKSIEKISIKDLTESDLSILNLLFTTKNL